MQTKVRSVLSATVISAVLGWQPACVAGSSDELETPAVQSAQANHAVLLGVVRAGERLVAVGERGVILLSDDNGLQWRQARVPVSVTLSAVQFVNAHEGWAVGHSGVVLHSRDGGESWSLQLEGKQAAQLELVAAQANADLTGQQARLASARQLVADGPDKPLLDLSFSDTRNGLVVGAYGLAFHTEDGGGSWQSLMGELPNPKGLHLYALRRSGQNVYLAGEQGLFLRSQDGGQYFERVVTPYDGSFFTLAKLPDGQLIVGGLRGNVLRSRDDGTSFQTLPNPVPVSIASAALGEGRLLLVNQAGGVLEGKVGEPTLKSLPVSPGPPLTAVAEAADGTLVGVGFAGPVRLLAHLAASPQSSE